MADGWSLVGTVIRSLSEALPVPIEKAMSRAYGPEWFSKVQAIVTSPPTPVMLRDPQLGLKVLWVYRKKAFARAISGPESELAIGYLRSVRNNWAHFEPITLSEARTAAEKASVLLGALGAPTSPLETIFGEIKSPAQGISFSLPDAPEGLTERELRASGFQGFGPIRSLRRGGLASVPSGPGVYIVLRPSQNPPLFLEVSPAGHFKDKDPSVPLSWLQDEWVDGAELVYVGKSIALRKRLTQLLSFGEGKRVGHWGGRMLWQLADVEEALVAWKATDALKPGDLEHAVLSLFMRDHGQLPYANLKMG